MTTPHAVAPGAYRAGVWLAVLAAFGFSMKAILVKLAYATPQAQPVAPITLLALRMAFSLPFFIFIALRESSNARPLSRRQWLAVLALGLLGYYCASIFDFIGLRYISAGLERLILFTYPTLTLLIGALFFGQPVGRRELGALALCYLGIGVAFAHDLHTSTDQWTVWVGGGFVLLSSIAYALYLSGSGRLIPLLGASRFTALALLVSGLATLLHFFLAQPLAALVQPWPVYGHALAMALLSTVLPVFAQSAAIRRIGSGRAALIGTLGPLLTIGMGWAVLDEAVSLWQLAGCALVVAGILRVSRAR